jgi:hypothetical protein
MREPRIDLGPLVHGAACPRCGAELQFFTRIEYGATYEQCPTRHCVYHEPHRPIPDHDPKPKQTELERQQRLGRTRLLRKIYNDRRSQA